MFISHLRLISHGSHPYWRRLPPTLTFDQAFQAARSGFEDKIATPDDSIDDDRTRLFDLETGVDLTTHSGAAIQQQGIGAAY